MRIIRQNVVVHQGELESLKRFQDDVRKSSKATECGRKSRTSTTQEGDQLEVFEIVEVARFRCKAQCQIDRGRRSPPFSWPARLGHQERPHGEKQFSALTASPSRCSANWLTSSTS